MWERRYRGGGGRDRRISAAPGEGGRRWSVEDPIPTIIAEPGVRGLRWRVECSSRARERECLVAAAVGEGKNAGKDSFWAGLAGTLGLF